MDKTAIGVTMGSAHRRRRQGYSIGEMLAALVIAALILTAILGVYGRAQRAVEAVSEKVDSPAMGDELIQLIARDLDRLVGVDGAHVEIKNGIDNGFSRAQLIIRQIFHDVQGNEQTLYQIVWQAAYDYESGAASLIVYRSYEGAIPEDKLFEEKRASWEKNYPFVPVCRGVTLFRIDVPRGNRYLDRWFGQAPPAGVRVTVSWAAPFETTQGTRDVLEDEKLVRTIAVDRTRTMKVSLSATGDANDPNAANAPTPSEPNVPQGIRR